MSIWQSSCASPKPSLPEVLMEVAMSNIPPILTQLLTGAVTDVTSPWAHLRSSRKRNAIWVAEYLCITTHTCESCGGSTELETPGWPGYLESCGCYGIEQISELYRIEVTISPDGEIVNITRQLTDAW